MSLNSWKEIWPSLFLSTSLIISFQTSSGIFPPPNICFSSSTDKDPLPSLSHILKVVSNLCFDKSYCLLIVAITNSDKLKNTWVVNMATIISVDTWHYFVYFVISFDCIHNLLVPNKKLLPTQLAVIIGVKGLESLKQLSLFFLSG